MVSALKKVPYIVQGTPSRRHEFGEALRLRCKRNDDEIGLGRPKVCRQHDMASGDAVRQVARHCCQKSGFVATSRSFVLVHGSGCALPVGR